MFQFVLQKIRSKKWMMLSLLIGNLLLVSIVCASPIYSQAILQRTLTRNLSDYLVEENEYPGAVTMETTIQKGNAKTAETAQEVEAMVEEIPGDFKLDAVASVGNYYLDNLSVVADEAREDETNHVISMGYLTDLTSHINIVSGELYTDEPNADGSINGIVSEAMMIKRDLLVGETYVFESISGSGGEELRVKVCGVYEASDASDNYWVNTPNDLSKELLISETYFKEHFLNEEDPPYTVKMRWDVLLDYTQMKGKDVSSILSTCRSYSRTMENLGSPVITFRFENIMNSYVVQAKKLNVTLWVLQVPVFVLLAAFLFMVSQQMLQLEEGEIAIFKSRGASKRQIITLYAMQSGILALVSLVVGIPLGLLLCRVLGASNAFMEFVNRTSLPMELSIQALLFALLAAFLSMVAMVLPVLKYANVTIVLQKRKKQRRLKWSWWEKCGLDVILLAVSLYGWYSFQQSKAYLAEQVQDGAAVDPLLFLSSSLFIIGAGLFALRIFPFLIRGIFAVGKKHWAPSLYVGFKRMTAAKAQHGFIMIFLMMTIALGIFNSMAARTINSNAEDRISYQNGADIVLLESWKSNAAAVSTDETNTKVLEYEEPDFNRYRSIEGVESATKVLVNDGLSVSFGDTSASNVLLMGINTKEFGETAWMKDGLLDSHWYNYLNAMAASADAVLVSSNLKKDYGLEIGDTIMYRDAEAGWAMRGVVYGFVDYWPSYNPVSVTQTDDGKESEISHYLVVANLQQIQASIGVTPYQVWLKMEDSTQPVYDFAAENGITYPVFRDTYAQKIEHKNDPVMQGTNGVLTIGFVVVLVVCMVGFLLYWILSIRSRQLQFGIFRAMGMSMKEVLSMLIIEQVCLSGFSIVAGAVIGQIASRLFVPLLELSYASSEQIIPIEIVSRVSDNVRIAVVIGLMLAACMGILGWQISKIKISQALKLGED